MLYTKTSKLSATLALATSLVVGAFVSCTSTPPKRHVPPGPRISVMSYNVENLFDTSHDTDKDDFTYLPVALKKKSPEIIAECEKVKNDFYRKECLNNDWSEDVLARKLERVSDVIKQINDGRGPDIQILIEVENKNVLDKLRNEYLKDSGYQTAILLEGPDKRGIDPAILSRFPEWDQPRLHTLPLKAEKPEDEYTAKYTRGILEARLKLPDGQKIAVFAIHLPSQQNPAYFRKQAIEYINKLQKELPPDVLPMAAGDFNISAEEDKNLGFFSQALASEWTITHLIGCKECEGTHNYRREWSFLDAIMVSKAMAPGGAAAWKIDPSSIRVPHESRYQVNKYGSPARFDEKTAIGVSDHWPIYAELYKPQP